MGSSKDKGIEYYYGKHCHECINCGTLLEYKWDEDDECSCQEQED